MRDLRINLDDTDFAQLVELARSLIPTYAPDWTDHNVHDPGIMLVELLAFIADAQIYALARTRRDERRAYAALLGIKPRGPQPARGLIWPLRNDNRGAVMDGISADTPTVVRTDQPIISDYPDAPVFFTTHAILLSPAKLVKVETRLDGDKTIDWTLVNSHDGASFHPFGTAHAPGQRLVLEFEGTLIPHGAAADANALLAIGIETAGWMATVGSGDTADSISMASRLIVTIEDISGEQPVELALDTTNGLSRSGVLLLRVGAGARPVEATFSITLRSASGAFLQAPHLRGIGLNVLPVRQLESVSEVVGDFGNNQPDQSYQLQNLGLVFPIQDRNFSLTVSERGEWHPWSPVADLQACGSDERAYQLDTDTGTISFGNGVNGAIPGAGAALSIDYLTSRGTQGNLPASQRWSVRGLAGIFGTNSEPMAGGSNGLGLQELQAAARRRSREERPYVTAKDLTEAALSFSDLGVTRAIEIMPGGGLRGHVRGTRILVVVGWHDSEGDEEESPVWVEEIRTRLAPHLPLGQGLIVMAPRYVETRIAAKLIATPGTDPATVQEAARTRLREELAIVPSHPGHAVWPFGRDITPLSVRGWLRRVEGIAQVAEVALFRAGSNTDGKPVDLGVIGLPRLHLAPTDITVERLPAGARQ